MIKQREYLFSIDKFKKPIVYTDNASIGLLLTRLILLEPGSNPLHPDMGVGLKQYRYTAEGVYELKNRIKNQIANFLPVFPNADVNIVQGKDHMLNIEITIDDVIYVYESENAPIKITLDMV